MKNEQKDLINRYLDGEMTESEKADFEEIIKNSKELKRNINNQKHLLDKLKAIGTLPKNENITKNILEMLHFRRESDMKKYVSVVGIVLLTIVFLIFYKFKSNDLDKFVEEQKNNLVSYYTTNLKPLFTGSELNSDDVFLFAFNHIIPVDKDKNQFLKIGYDNNGQDYFELVSGKVQRDLILKKDFEKRFNLNSEEVTRLNELLEKYKEKISEQIVVGQNNSIGISQNLWTLNKAIAAEILQYTQRINRNMYDEIIPYQSSEIANDDIYKLVQTSISSGSNNYVFFTPDTIFSTPIEPVQIGSYTNVKPPNLENKHIAFAFNLDTTCRVYKNKVRSDFKFTMNIDSNIIKIEVPDFQVSNIDSILLKVELIQDKLNRRLQIDLQNDLKHLKQLEKLHKLQFKIPDIDSIVDISLKHIETDKTIPNIDSIINIEIKKYKRPIKNEVVQIPNIDSIVMVSLNNLTVLKDLKICIPNIDSIVRSSLKSVNSNNADKKNFHPRKRIIRSQSSETDSVSVIIKTENEKTEK